MTTNRTVQLVLGVTLILVEAPGERLAAPIPKKGHRGTRYTDGADWPD